MKFYFLGNRIKSTAQYRPKMTKHAGAIWRHFTEYINDHPYKFYMDINHGKCFYFEFDGKWYRCPIDYRLDPRISTFTLTTTAAGIYKNF